MKKSNREQKSKPKFLENELSAAPDEPATELPAAKKSEAPSKGKKPAPKPVSAKAGKPVGRKPALKKKKVAVKPKKKIVAQAKKAIGRKPAVKKPGLIGRKTDLLKMGEGAFLYALELTRRVEEMESEIAGYQRAFEAIRNLFSREMDEIEEWLGEALE
jgi:hypothetical protein